MPVEEGDSTLVDAQPLPHGIASLDRAVERADASHVAMDPLPLPYDGTPLRSSSFWEAVASQAWNAVIDMAFYGTLAVLVFERNGNGTNGKRAEA